MRFADEVGGRLLAAGDGRLVGPNPPGLQAEVRGRVAERAPPDAVRPGRLRAGDIGDGAVAEVRRNARPPGGLRAELSVTRLGTSATARFSTIIGRCLAVIRIAESDIRLLASTIPSTVGMARSSASRSRTSDSCASASSMV